MSVKIEFTGNARPLADVYLTGLTVLLEKMLAEKGLKEGEVNLILCNDHLMQELNRDYRDKDRPTDVLSFSYLDQPVAADAPEDLDAVGDIFISLERAALQAEDAGHSLEREVTLLAVHGMLHLFGYDHMQDADHQLMRARENELMKLFDSGDFGSYKHE